VQMTQRVSVDCRPARVFLVGLALPGHDDGMVVVDTARCVR
jgi:hypothetical protein